MQHVLCNDCNPILFCEVVEEVWSTAVYNATNKVITFNLKGNSYSINGDVLNTSLNLPANTHAKSPSEVDIRKMLNEINYSTPNANLGKIVRKNLRKEWSYFFDSLIKVFSGKISNFDAITSVIQEIAYGVLYNHFHDLGELLIIEIGTKLGNIESRSKNIYYARFIMLIANHVVPNLVVDQPENQLVCWVQNKRLFKDLVRINLHEGTQLRMPQVIHVFLSSSLISQNSLPSTAAMEGVNVLNPPTQAAKPKKISKSKSKTTSDVSQKTSVVKTTKSQLVGSEQVSSVGEGIGEHQRTLEDKEGEGVKNLPSHATSSQKDVSINMEINTILSTSSQKDLDIEKSFNPGAQNTGGGGGVTKAKTITPYVRKKKGVKTQLAHGEHTQHILETSSLEKVLSSSSTLFDASQTNVEMQPHSLSIQPSSHHSNSQTSFDIFMTDNMEISKFPISQTHGGAKNPT